jgi:transcriptional adapter 2-alpha
MCLPCYTKGQEKSAHTRTHSYFLIDTLRFPLYTPSWTCKEEQLLLDNLLKLRYGNWVSISEALGGSKSPEECESHYKQLYLHKTIDDLRQYEVISYKDENGFILQTPVNNQPFFNSFSEADEHFDKKNEHERGPAIEFTGYMSLRKDFEIEYENDIENYLADLEFYDDDRPEDIELKLKQLEAYQQVLDEREERKKFVIERWPLEIKAEKKFRNNVFEKNVFQTLKPVARFLPPDKHHSFCDALVKESILKMKLDELKEAKNRGIRTEEEFRKFLLQKKLSFPQKSKEYELLAKEGFSYKAAESQKQEILENLERKTLDSRTIEKEFCERVGLNPSQFESLKDKIAGSMETRAGSTSDDLLDEHLKKEFIDFIVKNKMH